MRTLLYRNFRLLILCIVLIALWGYASFPTTRTVDFHVLSLRKKIEVSGKKPVHLLTVQGVGYRFEPQG